MQILIDGYNLLFRVFSTEIPLQDARNKLITSLELKARDLNVEITIVFDSAWQNEISPSHFGVLHIIFAPRSQSADDLLLEILERGKSREAPWLITSDKPLARKAKHLGAKILSISEFQAWLSKREKKQARVFSKKTSNQDLLAKALTKTSEKKADAQPGTMEYYLKQFDAKEPSTTIQVTSSKLIPESIDEPRENDFDRWLRVFENRLTQENELSSKKSNRKGVPKKPKKPLS